MWLLRHIWNSVRKPGRGKRVFVGVSGGVDSSVSALLLKLYGYDVTSVFIQTWQPDWISCTWRDERRDAMRVCAHLEIPFVDLDLTSEYKQGVADYMIREYQSGRTPNPDVMCNREVKFGGFLQFAIDQGADYIATGHYAQNNNNQLIKGYDKDKDQSYFLWTLTKSQLQKIIFPVGHLPKTVTRKIASWYKLPTATKKDSQGICFIGDIDMKEFLEHYIHKQPGNVIDEDGKIIGNHDGALFFTLGERHGFTITEKGTREKPYYVIAKNIHDNTITVSQHVQPTQKNQSVLLTDCVWRVHLKKNYRYSAQIRYHGELKSCHIVEKDNHQFEIIFDTYDKTLAPGQSIVVYDDQVCIGGGIVL